MKRVRLSTVVIVLMALLCGCTTVAPQQNPGPTLITDPDQVTTLILQHLADKYGEEFVPNEEIQPEYHDFLGGGTPWILCVVPSAGTNDSLFCAKWADPVAGGEDAIIDSYLLIKMRPVFQDAIDEGLASVLSDFLAEYGLSDYPSHVSDLPGDITDEEFLQWAAQNISVIAQIAIPAEEGFTLDDLLAQMEPLSGSGNTFGAAMVSLNVGAYTQDGYQDWVSRWEAAGASRTEPGMNWNLVPEGTANPDLLFSQIIPWGER